MWTRLMYLTMPQAIKPTFIKGKWHGPILSARYKNLLKKQFRLAGVPWIYEKPRDESLNPRHRPPKQRKFVREKPIRIAKIKKALENADDNELKFRQERLNNRELSCADLIIKKAIPYWISLKRDSVKESENEGEGIVEGSKRKSYSNKKKE